MTDRTELARRYDANAERYDDVTAYNREAAQRLVASLPPGRYDRVLDVGCGTGFASLAMVDRFRSRHITGVDVSEEMLGRMREKFRSVDATQLELHVADVMSMPVASSAFDAVLASMALHWFADRAGAIQAMTRTLAPAGILGLVAPGAGHDREYVDVLRSLTPPIPAPLIEIFDTAQVHPEVTEQQLVGAGLEPIDVWEERRHRHVDPDRYMGRITTVGSHVWTALMGAEAAQEMERRITEAVHRAAGPRGFAYTFTKTYAIARRPG